MAGRERRGEGGGVPPDAGQLRAGLVRLEVDQLLLPPLAHGQSGKSGTLIDLISLESLVLLYVMDTRTVTVDLSVPHSLSPWYKNETDFSLTAVKDTL